ncbi:MAG: membrane protein insertase YidC, partial [Candidatus Poribacteria bacterium]|nr:membrane protein insertase YidC [Candidatus Poribacteria bacterium]
YMPKEYGAMGGLLSTGQLPTLTPIRDDDLDAPGPQTKDGEDADAIENKRTVWSAIQSKFFIATFLSGELTSPQAALPRSARFSEYNPFPLKWPSEPERYRIVLNVGKEWLTDSEHLNQSKTKRFLLIPSGTTRLNAEITQAVQGAKDTDKARRKTRETLQRAYADYGNVAELLSGMRLEVDGFFLQPGQSQTDTYRLYAGPKHTAILSHVVLPDNVTPAKITETISFGITGPLAKGLLWLLNAFHKLIPNYGVAIILLTILVRLALFPLSQSSSKSMKKMQNRMKIIQPELDDARKKFGDDPQKMNAETMKVYRKYGINPASQLGGCLMILAQMPIFIAMYSMLRNSAELRGEPFTLWINDLTAPDLLYSVGGLPIRLLPLIVMGGTLIQQRMNPTAGTMQGSQKMMMNLMPIMFVFIFYGMASGLNLYWGISTFIGVGQQYLVNKFSEDTEENLTAADLERMAKQDRKKKRQRAPARP